MPFQQKLENERVGSFPWSRRIGSGFKPHVGRMIFDQEVRSWRKAGLYVSCAGGLVPFSIQKLSQLSLRQIQPCAKT